MKQQVVVIHGGDSSPTQKKFLRSLRTQFVSVTSFLPRKGWKARLQKDLGQKFQVLLPQMPNKSNAKYIEWKIWFKRMFPFLHHGVILVGHSLGGMFLAKYLAENTFPKKITAVVIIAAPHNQTAELDSFKIPKSLRRLAKQTQHIFLFHSPNDPFVPFSELGVYVKALPKAQLMVIKKRQHFNQETFPELVRLIKRLGK